jgi:hypothetical protein
LAVLRVSAVRFWFSDHMWHSRPRLRSDHPFLIPVIRVDQC